MPDVLAGEGAASRANHFVPAPAMLRNRLSAGSRVQFSTSARTSHNTEPPATGPTLVLAEQQFIAGR